MATRSKPKNVQTANMTDIYPGNVKEGPHQPSTLSSINNQRPLARYVAGTVSIRCPRAATREGTAEAAMAEAVASLF
ncbi:unnamed protein product [Cuscuta campestris]|uniref:Uncharacterized protein n=1 Tax=Cuscuta campestris TaxID=132261 RepID=A0A484NMS3_9ASTE|nr:unnamed protein product [Cuscuta campestris]